MATGTRYHQFCPIAKAAEVLAVRWVPLIIRELLCGRHRFNEIHRGVPLMSPSLLSTRLSELEFNGIVYKEPAKAGRGYEYFLTESGAALGPILMAQGAWAQKWLKQELSADELDPAILMWDIHRRASEEQVSYDERLNVYFELSGVDPKSRRWWLLFQDGSADLCMKDPGYEVDLYVNGSLRTLTEVWMGQRKLKDALDNEMIKLDGAKSVCGDFGNWFVLSVMAPTAQPLA